MTGTTGGFRPWLLAALLATFGSQLANDNLALATDAIEGDDYFSTDLHPGGKKATASPTAPTKRPGTLAGDAPSPAPAAAVKGEAAAAAAPTSTNRVREGTRLQDRLGAFKITGEGVTFYSGDGELRLSGLQNLAMERVARVLRESHSEPEWMVTGVVTEYEGGNFLLLQRAVLKTRLNLPGGAFPGAGK